jgi:hypothetical protein
MALLTVQKSKANTALVTAYGTAAAGGDTFANDGATSLYVKNGGASVCNVTIASPVKCSHGSNHDVIVAVAAGQTIQIGPFPQNRFNNDTGLITVTYSQVTTVTVAAVSTN